MVWRPVIEKVATRAEIKQHWNICDLYDCNDALDISAEVEHKRVAYDKAKNGGKF